MGVPTISRPLLWFFRVIVRLWFWVHFRAVRVSGVERLRGVTGPLIVFGNHSSWWDPMIAVLLGMRLLPGRSHFAPMDASSLKKQWILQRIGIFPVELGSARGGAQFLRTSLAILAARGVVWVTPQGRFADVRERPLGFKPGLAALAARVPGCTLIPLATEYGFWNERRPEALAYFGEPVVVDGAAGLEGRLEAALLEAMAVLERKAIARDAAEFEVTL